jgi:NAD kinase
MFRQLFIITTLLLILSFVHAEEYVPTQNDDFTYVYEIRVPITPNRYNYFEVSLGSESEFESYLLLNDIMIYTYNIPIIQRIQYNKGFVNDFQSPDGIFLLTPIVELVEVLE